MFYTYVMKICSIDGCGKKIHGREWCSTHYKHWLHKHNPAYRAREYARTAKWKRDNKDYYNTYISNKRARVKRATPPWVDQSELRRIYANCPKGYHVDHIYPLNGRISSGLHVPWNLQYLPAIENLKKGNKVL